MILYLDTSSLLKLYLEEEHSDLVRTWADGAQVLCTSSEVHEPRAAR